jgi:hypothetical protein
MSRGPTPTGAELCISARRREGEIDFVDPLALKNRTVQAAAGVPKHQQRSSGRGKMLDRQNQ